MNVESTAVGLDGLRRQLRTIDRTLPSRVITPAMRSAAEEVLPDAVRLAPRGRTGKLARTVRVVASQKRVALRAGRSGVSYARFVHWGTRYQRAQPFLKLVAENERDRVLEAAEREVAVALRREGLTVGRT